MNLVATLILVALVASVAIGLWEWVRDSLQMGFVFWRKLDKSRVNAADAYELLEAFKDDLFGGNRGVRLTLFAPDERDPSALRPVLRHGWGRPSWTSTVRFRRGEGLAGIVWEQYASAAPQNRGLLIAAAASPPQSIEVARAAAAAAFHLPPETARKLSDAQLRVQFMLACALVDAQSNLRGILCIDSQDAVTDFRQFVTSDPFNMTLRDYLQRLALTIRLPESQPALTKAPSVENREHYSFARVDFCEGPRDFAPRLAVAGVGGNKRVI